MANKKKKLVKKTTKKTVKKPTKKVAKKAAKKTTKKKTTKKSVKPVAKKTLKKTGAQPISSLKPVPKANVDYSKAITPLGDRLVVRVTHSEKITPGGLIIPDSASSIATGYLKAMVLAVGSGAKSKKGHLRPLDVKIGDTVLFAEHSGTKVSFNSEDLQIIHETDVMGVVQN
ncbi:MAG: co-chaperone GroES [Bdellovibrionota bacterium]